VRLTIPRLLDRRAWTTSSLERAPAQPETFWRARRSRVFNRALYTPFARQFMSASSSSLLSSDSSAWATAFVFFATVAPAFAAPAPAWPALSAACFFSFNPCVSAAFAPLPSANSATSGAHSRGRGVSAAGGLVARAPQPDDARVGAGDSCPQGEEMRPGTVSTPSQAREAAESPLEGRAR